MKANKNSLLVYLTLLFIVILTSSFNQKKKTIAGAYTTCTWYANTSSIYSADLMDDNTQYNATTNITTSWSTLIVLIVNYVQIDTRINGTHPAGTLKVYRDGTLVSTHAIGANEDRVFTDSFPFYFQAKYEVVW